MGRAEVGEWFMNVTPAELRQRGAGRVSDDLDLAADSAAASPGPRKRHGRRWLAFFLVVGIVAVTLVAVVVVSRASRGGGKYREATASTGTMRLSVAGTGTLEPAQMTSLRFQVAGQVATVPVTVGQHVKGGQTLATINSAGLAAQVAQAKATLADDQARLSTDQSANAPSAQQAADQAAVTADQAALTNANAVLSQATLTSPIAGTVAQLNLTVGQQVTASNNNDSSGGNGSSGPAPQIVVVGAAFVVNASIDDTQ